MTLDAAKEKYKGLIETEMPAKPTGFCDSSFFDVGMVTVINWTEMPAKPIGFCDPIASSSLRNIE